MKTTKVIQSYGPFWALLASVCLLPATVFGNVCSEGRGVPPFLSAGANPNLLMILDNSGSMLDPAYIDDDGVTTKVDTKGVTTCTQDPVDAPNPTACMDESYLVDPLKTTCNAGGTYNTTLDPDKTYAGYFKKDAMYFWKKEPLPAFVKTYDAVTASGCVDPPPAALPIPGVDPLAILIFDNSVLYRAECTVSNCTTAAGKPGCKTSGVTVAEDNKAASGFKWSPYFSFATWVPNKIYDAKTFIKHEKQLYYTATGGNDAGATSPPAHWQPVDFTWQPGYFYGANNIVSYNGMIFYNSAGAFTSSATGLFDDLAGGVFPWKRIGDSYFEEYTGGLASPCSDPAVIPAGSPATPSFTYSHATASGMITDMAVTMTNKQPLPNKVTSQTILDINAVTAQLNTELAKANPDPVLVTTLIDKRNLLMPSATTCFAATGNFLNWAASSKFDIEKKILTGGKLYTGEKTKDQDDRLIMENRGCAGKNYVKQITVDPANNIKMTMRVRGSSEDDWLGTNDDVTRIDIFGITVGGYNDKQCRLAVDLMETGGSLPDVRAALEKCMYATNVPSDSHDAKTKQIYFSAVHTCVQSAKAGGDLEDYNKGGELSNFCQDLYLGLNGFKATNPWDITPYEPEYICYGMYIPASKWPYTWDEGNLGFMGRLWRVYPEDAVVCNDACDCADTSIHPWLAGAGYCYESTGAKTEIRCTNNQLTDCTYNAAKKTWTCVKRNEDPTGAPCTPTGAVKNECTSGSIDATCWALNSSGGNAAASDDMWKYALRDYCRQVEVPEVIDPSDQVTSTPGSGNIPASLIDSGMYDQLGQGQQLLTMKGYVKWVIPADQVQEQSVNRTKERPVGPRGVLYDVAEDLRLGVMAFKDNGSQAECKYLQATCGTKVNDTFAVCNTADKTTYDATKCQYCIEREPIDKFCPSVNGDGARVIAAIEQGMYSDENGTPADATDDIERWGHYKTVRSAINAARATSWTPLAEAVYTSIGYYGQNTARRLAPNADFPNMYDFRTAAEVNPYASGTKYEPGAMVVDAGGVYYQTALGGVAKSASGKPADDTSVFWSVVSTLDPIQFWCQDNHVLIITEGASTSDADPDVIGFVNTTSTTGDPTLSPPQPPIDDGAGPDTVCTDGLEGSTYLNDLTYIGKNAQANYLYSVPTINGEDKQNITTHVVATGSLRSDAAGECSPKTIMQSAASNGGTALYSGEKPDQLESNLRAALTAIMSRASAGSAASVISSSRSGEGAVYQAIFWPNIIRGTQEDPLAWVGDVHALFVDSYGRLWDDYSGHEAGPAPGIAKDAQNITGRLWSEDTNGNGLIDAGEDKNLNGYLDGDRRVITYYDGDITQICFNESIVTTGTCDKISQYAGAGVYDEPQDLKAFRFYLWSVKDRLQEFLYKDYQTPATDDYKINRGLDPADKTWDFSENRRYIFTWNDLDNDGIVDTDIDRDGVVDTAGVTASNTNEVLDLTETVAWNSLNPLSDPNVHHNVIADFDVPSQAELTGLINWVRGGDGEYEVDTDGDGLLDPAEDLNGNGKRDYKYRCRYPGSCNPSLFNGTDPQNFSWLVGDVIHSTPILVSRPAEAYHFVYRDQSYAAFSAHYKNRRHMIYFGSNDGLLHAVNGGFYDEADNSFMPCAPDQRDGSGNCIEPQPYSGSMQNAYAALGDEMWAYLPANLQPHLKCLSDPEYKHKYYVDQRPRVVDVRIFPNDSVHINGWGTLLIGSMRFGGAPTLAEELTYTAAGDNRKFISSFFVLDITDPERPPVLLGEMTMTATNDIDGDGIPDDDFASMGYTTSSPSLIVMRDDVNGNPKWYLVMGNGPSDIAGRNDLQGRIAVIPMESFGGEIPPYPLDGNPGPLYGNREPFRIPNTELGASCAGCTTGVYTLPGTASGPESFIGDIITVDYDIEGPDFLPDNSVVYKADAIYFGTTDGQQFTGVPYATKWGGGGRMYRLVTKLMGAPDLGPGGTGKKTQLLTKPEDWYLSKLIDAKAPITAGPGIGYDGDNFWVYFGTGRFYDADDKTDDNPNYFFGVKEPTDCTAPPCECNQIYCGRPGQRLTWATIDWWSGITNTPVSLSPGSAAGNRGLFRSDYVEVALRTASTIDNKAYIWCDPAAPAGSCNLSFLTPLTGHPDLYAFEDLRKYISGEPCGFGPGTSWMCSELDDVNYPNGIDGWYRELRDDRERVIGQATLLGGLVTFSSYIPFADTCKAEGESWLYGVHYQTGTPWYENVFGTYTSGKGPEAVHARFDLGVGMTTTPSLHVGSGDADAKAFIQTSTGEIIEVEQENLPLKNFKSGRISWSDTCDE